MSMKRIIPLLIALSSIFTVSSEGAADAPKDRGPEVINLKMKGMVMPFKHWKHQKEAKSDCRDCHSRKIGKIEGWGEDTAHKVCIPCHDLEEKGPVLCHQCHDKK